MKEPIFKLQQNKQENLSNENLSDKLELLYEKRKALSNEIFKRYDRKKMASYIQVLNHFRGDEDRVSIYFNSMEEGADIVDNYLKIKNFKENKIFPLEKDIKEAEEKLRIIRHEKREEEEVIRDIETEEKFKEEKNNFIGGLYEDLDKLHQQIPEEAKEVGMSAEIAIETYLPELAGKAKLLEYFIGEAEKAKYSFDLENIKRRMKNYGIE